MENQVIKYHNNWLDRPVYISGQMKSGTSLLHALMDGNPEMYVFPSPPCFQILFARNYTNTKHMVIDWLVGNQSELLQPENKILDYDRNKIFRPISEKYADLSVNSLQLTGSIRSMPDNKNRFSFEEYHTNLKKYLSAGPLTKKEVVRHTAMAAVEASRDYKKKYPLKLWAYRQTYTSSTSAFTAILKQSNEIECLFGMFPGAKAVFIVRQPHAIVLSYERQFKGRRSEQFPEKQINFFSDIKRVNASLIELAEIERQYGINRIKIIKYEDLVLNTKNVMEDVCSFLNITFSENMLKPTCLGVPIHVVTAYDFDGTNVNATRISRWKYKLTRFQKLLIDAGLSSHFKFNGKKWGYSPHSNLLIIYFIRILFYMPTLIMLRTWGLIKNIKNPLL